MCAIARQDGRLTGLSLPQALTAAASFRAAGCAAGPARIVVRGAAARPVVLTAGNIGEQGTTNLIVLRRVPGGEAPASDERTAVDGAPALTG